MRSTLRRYGNLAIIGLALISSIQMARTQTSAADEKAWFEAFLNWAMALSAEDFNTRGKVEQLYRKELAVEKLPAAEVDARWSSIVRQQRGSEKWSTLFLNKRYAAGWYQGTPPSKYLTDFAKATPVGKALDCGMGAGRNAVLLAALGWDVTGIDISDVALKRASALAEKSGVKIHPVLSSYRDFDWGQSQWDLIVNIDSWDGEGLVPSTFATAPIRAALKAGGFLYIESHLPALTSPDQPLVKAFSDLRLVKYSRTVDPDWAGASKEMVIFIVQK